MASSPGATRATGAQSFVGVVHYLLYQQPDNPLAQYYPSLTHAPQPAYEAYPHFRDFCLTRQTDIYS
jgi:hypothetical protein